MTETAWREVATSVARGAAAVTRIDVGERDAVFAEIENDGVRRWIRVHDGTSIEVSPWQDRRVPLGGALTPLERAGARVLSYRPERRIVLRVERDRVPWIEKGYRSGRAANAALAHRRAAAALAGSPVGTAPLHEERPGSSSLVFEWVGGCRLRLDATDATSVLGILGRGLRALQDAPAPDEESPIWEPPSFTAADELATVERWRSRALRVRGVLPDGWDELWPRCARALRGTPPVPTGLAHRDLHDGQLLVDGAAVTLLDFDLLGHAEVALDPGNLIAHLYLRSLQRPRVIGGEVVAALRSAFLGGLDRDHEPGFLERLACYEASSSLRLALVYFVRPRWESLAGPLVAHAERCLETCS